MGDSNYRVSGVFRGWQYEEPISTQGLIAGSTAGPVLDSNSEEVGSTNRGTASNSDAGSVWTVDENERDHAHAELDKLAQRLTPKMYDALVAAALGETFDSIGRKFMPGLSPTDKRPGTMGKAVVIDALEILILKEFREAA